MPKRSAPLTDKQCRQLKYDPESRSANKLRDGDGLFLHVLSTGRKVWRLEYRTAKGTRSEATFPHDYGAEYGSLAAARAWRAETKALIAEGIDPVQHVKAQRAARHAAAISTFRAASEEWIAHKSEDWAPATQAKVVSTLDNVLMPWLGPRPVAEITPQEILHCLQRYERQNKRSMAHNAKTYAGQIFRRTIVLGLRNDDPAAALKGALKPKNEREMAHLQSDAEIGGLLRAIDAYHGTPTVRAALRLLPLLFCRPGELRMACWAEVDTEAGIWEIPAERMKMRRAHIVPLSVQAKAILSELASFTRHSGEDLLFPAVRHKGRPMSENTLNAALRSMGYDKSQQTAHGFRHIASTKLHDLGWDSMVIERQLAHKDPNEMRRKYNKATYWEKRVEMMQAWADYLDSIKLGRGKVVGINHAVGAGSS